MSSNQKGTGLDRDLRPTHNKTEQYASGSCFDKFDMCTQPDREPRSFSLRKITQSSPRPSTSRRHEVVGVIRRVLSLKPYHGTSAA